MKNMMPLAALLSCSIGFCACGGAPTKTQTPSFRLSLCLPRAMHLGMMWGPDTGPEEIRKLRFEDYYESFLDAREQQKYVDCLKKDQPPDYKKDLKKAERWLKTAQESLARGESFFPAQQRIQDVQESFLYPDDKNFTRRVVVTLKDGTQKVVEKSFPRAAPAAQ